MTKAMGLKNILPLLEAEELSCAPPSWKSLDMLEKELGTPALLLELYLDNLAKAKTQEIALSIHLDDEEAKQKAAQTVFRRSFLGVYRSPMPFSQDTQVYLSPAMCSLLQKDMSAHEAAQPTGKPLARGKSRLAERPEGWISAAELSKNRSCSREQVSADFTLLRDLLVEKMSNDPLAEKEVQLAVKKHLFGTYPTNEWGGHSLMASPLAMDVFDHKSDIIDFNLAEVRAARYRLKRQPRSTVGHQL